MERAMDPVPPPPRSTMKTATAFMRPAIWLTSASVIVGVCITWWYGYDEQQTVGKSSSVTCTRPEPALTRTLELASSEWIDDVRSALAASNLTLSGNSSDVLSYNEIVQRFEQMISGNDTRVLQDALAAARVRRARILLCSDRHTYCLSGIGMRRLLHWVSSTVRVPAEDVLVLVEWIPSSNSVEFERLTRPLASNPRALHDAVRAFLMANWPWPVADHTETLAAAVCHGFHVRGVGPGAVAGLPLEDVPDSRRFPVGGVTPERAAEVKRTQDALVVDSATAWLKYGRANRLVVVMTGSLHNLREPGGVRSLLRAQGMEPLLILNGLPRIDRSMLEATGGPPQVHWIEFGRHAIYGPLLQPEDWMEYVHRPEHR